MKEIKEITKEIFEKTGGSIDSFSVTNYSCGGMSREGRKFYLIFFHDFYFVLIMHKDEEEQEIFINICSNVLGYGPFCLYTEDDAFVVEWDKKDPEARFAQLIKEGKSNLRKIKPQ